jgi:hypothetical protein
MTGPEALQLLRDGKRVRKHFWTNGCWISAKWNDDFGVWEFKGHGTITFRRDVDEDQSWILNDLMDDGWIDEIDPGVFK